MPTRPWGGGGVLRPQAKGPPGSGGSGGHYFFSNNALEGILYFISPLLYRKTGLCLLFLRDNCF